MISLKVEKFIVLAILQLLLLSVACSSDNGSSVPETNLPVSVSASETSFTVSSTLSPTSTSVALLPVEDVGIVLPFTASNGEGTVQVSGSSAVAVWFGGLPGEVSLDLVDADIEDVGSVVEELVSFWFFQDDSSGDVPPTIVVSADGMVSDSLGTRYVVEAASFPAAPTAEAGSTLPATSTTTTTTTTTSTTEPPEVAPEPSVTSTPEAPPPTSSTTTEPPPEEPELPAFLQVQVLNGSGVAGAAGRMTSRLAEAGYVMLPAGNAPRRYSSSAVYYAEGWEEDAQQILEEADLEEVEAVTAMPDIFATENAAVVILLGTDTAPAVAQEQAGLRPKQRNDVTLPLGPEVPRDRYVPGLININIYTPQTDADEQVFLFTDALQRAIGFIGDYANEEFMSVIPENRTNREDYDNALKAIEENLEWLGFTPQNVCGAPAGYTFRELLKPTREWVDSRFTWSGDLIRTTERLLELHGGERINPEENLDFYIREAAQTSYDYLRATELLDELEAPQLLLCRAWLSPGGGIADGAQSLWSMLATPGIQPRENLISQGTFNVKYISKNGNRAGLWVCHPTLGESNIMLHWREAGYRALLTHSRNAGCQASYNEFNSSGIPFQEEMIIFGFGEQMFPVSDLLQFPRG